jgi:hypothetical protein
MCWEKRFGPSVLLRRRAACNLEIGMPTFPAECLGCFANEVAADDVLTRAACDRFDAVSGGGLWALEATFDLGAWYRMHFGSGEICAVWA